MLLCQDDGHSGLWGELPFTFLNTNLFEASGLAIEMFIIGDAPPEATAGHLHGAEVQAPVAGPSVADSKPHPGPVVLTLGTRHRQALRNALETLETKNAQEHSAGVRPGAQKDETALPQLIDVEDAETGQTWRADISRALQRWGPGQGSLRSWTLAPLPVHQLMEALYHLGPGIWVTLPGVSPVPWRRPVGRKITAVDALHWLEDHGFDPPAELLTLPEAKLLNPVPATPPGEAEPSAGRVPAPPPPASGVQAPPRAKGKRINERMLATIQSHEEAVYWSARRWSKQLKCTHSTILDTPTWKKVCRPARERERLSRGHRLRGPKRRRAKGDNDISTEGE
jgi:hypothetical protein